MYTVGYPLHSIQDLAGIALDLENYIRFFECVGISDMFREGKKVILSDHSTIRGRTYYARHMIRLYARHADTCPLMEWECLEKSYKVVRDCCTGCNYSMYLYLHNYIIDIFTGRR